MIITTKIIAYLILSKKISCLRTFLLIKELFSGNLNATRENILLLATELGTSEANIKKHLKQLSAIDIALLDDHQNGWFFAVGNTRHDRREDEKSKFKATFELEDLKDLKSFRTKCYAFLIQEAAQKTRKFTDKKLEKQIKEKFVNKSKRRSKAASRAIMDINYEPQYELSISLISEVTKLSKSVVQKHRSRANDYGFLTYKRRIEVFMCTDSFSKKRLSTMRKVEFDFESMEIKTSQEIWAYKKFSDNSILDAPNCFILKQKDKPLIAEAIVREVTPKIMFNIATERVFVEQKIIKKDVKEVEFFDSTPNYINIFDICFPMKNTKEKVTKKTSIDYEEKMLLKRAYMTIHNSKN